VTISDTKVIEIHLHHDTEVVDVVDDIAVTQGELNPPIWDTDPSSNMDLSADNSPPPTYSLAPLLQCRFCGRSNHQEQQCSQRLMTKQGRPRTRIVSLCGREDLLGSLRALTCLPLPDDTPVAPNDYTVVEQDNTHVKQENIIIRDDGLTNPENAWPLIPLSSMRYNSWHTADPQALILLNKGTTAFLKYLTHITMEIIHQESTETGDDDDTITEPVVMMTPWHIFRAIYKHRRGHCDFLAQSYMEKEAVTTTARDVKEESIAAHDGGMDIES
jgi:hypothetical protein